MTNGFYFWKIQVLTQLLLDQVDDFTWTQGSEWADLKGSLACRGLVQFVSFASYGVILQVVVSVSFLIGQNLFVFTSVISDMIQKTDRNKWALYQWKVTAYFLGDSKSPYLFKNNHDPNITKRQLGVWKTKIPTHSINTNLLFHVNWDPNSEITLAVWFKNLKWVCGVRQSLIQFPSSQLVSCRISGKLFNTSGSIPSPVK